VLDNNVGTVLEQLRREFPEYRFLELPAEDVRTKPARSPRTEIVGLLNSEGVVRDECKARLVALVEEANDYLQA